MSGVSETHIKYECGEFYTRFFDRVCTVNRDSSYCIYFSFYFSAIRFCSSKVNEIAMRVD